MNSTFAIEVKGLCKQFKKRAVIQGIDLTVEKGEIYGFLGPNGAGKTTTIRTMLGLVKPDSGQIFINGYNINTQFEKAIADVGAIVESPSLYPYLTGRENLKLAANFRPDLDINRIEEVLQLVKLSGRADDKVKTYSLGMRQRLGIALALLNQPKLVVLDEPTNGLDPEGIKDIRDIVAKMSAEQGITFFISSHLIHEVEQICTKVGVLKNGRLLVQGNVSELLRRNEEVIEVSTPDADSAAAALQQVDFVKSVCKREGSITVEIEHGFSAKINRLLIEKGIEVNQMIVKKNTLEEVFFELTEGEK